MALHNSSFESEQISRVAIFIVPDGIFFGKICNYFSFRDHHDYLKNYANVILTITNDKK